MLHAQHYSQKDDDTGLLLRNEMTHYLFMAHPSPWLHA